MVAAAETEIKPRQIGYRGAWVLSCRLWRHAQARIPTLDNRSPSAEVESNLSRSLNSKTAAHVDDPERRATTATPRNPVPREVKGKEPRRDQHPLTFEQVQQ